MKLIPKLKSKFKDKFKIGVETSGGEIIPLADCPLEKHPKWNLVINEQGGPSYFCWDDYGDIIIARRNNVSPDVQCLSFRNFRGKSAIINFIYNAAVAGDRNYTLPVAKFVDAQNIVGARINNDEIQIVQCYNGTWTTLATAAKKIGAWRVIITSQEIYIYDDFDGSLLAQANHDIINEGWFGIMGHEWDYDGTHLLRGYNVQIIKEASIPCMTDYNAPYGQVIHGSEYGDPYLSWKAFNCTASSPIDAWAAPIGEDPDNGWVQWFDPDITPFIPQSISIKPRVGMTADWYHRNNPQGLAVYGVNQDGTTEKILDLFDLGDWDDDTIRTWTINTDKRFYGIRVHVTKTNESEAGNDYHTAIGYIDLRAISVDIYTLDVDIFEMPDTADLTVDIVELPDTANLTVTIQEALEE